MNIVEIGQEPEEVIINQGYKLTQGTGKATGGVSGMASSFDSSTIAGAEYFVAYRISPSGGGCFIGIGETVYIIGYRAFYPQSGSGDSTSREINSSGFSYRDAYPEDGEYIVYAFSDFATMTQTLSELGEAGLNRLSISTILDDYPSYQGGERYWLIA